MASDPSPNAAFVAKPQLRVKILNCLLKLLPVQRTSSQPSVGLHLAQSLCELLPSLLSPADDSSQELASLARSGLHTIALLTRPRVPPVYLTPAQAHLEEEVEAVECDTHERKEDNPYKAGPLQGLEVPRAQIIPPLTATNQSPSNYCSTSSAAALVSNWPQNSTNPAPDELQGAHLTVNSSGAHSDTIPTKELTCEVARPHHSSASVIPLEPQLLDRGRRLSDGDASFQMRKRKSDDLDSGLRLQEALELKKRHCEDHRRGSENSDSSDGPIPHLEFDDDVDESDDDRSGDAGGGGEACSVKD